MNREQPIQIIAGPCSIDQENVHQIYKIAELGLAHGVRIVGGKSRTMLNPNGEGMGIDYDVINKNIQRLHKGEELEIPPSVIIAHEFYNQTGLMIATEILDPHLQIPLYKGFVPDNKILAWSPSVQQLGLPTMVMRALGGTEMTIGIKNGKHIGDINLTDAQTPNLELKTSIETAWEGLFSYAGGFGSNTVLIHRGFDVQGKGNYRNIPVHQIALRVKNRTGAKMFWDPSHSYGPKLRDSIVAGTIDAMNIKMPDESFLYDGILIEVGTAKSDTLQHITVEELYEMVNKISKYRKLYEM